MEKFEDELARLGAAVNSVKDYFKSPEKYNLEFLLVETVCPVLEERLKDLCLQIEERHKVSETENKKERFVIHYTNIAVLVTMLQDAAKDNQSSSLRLYDSVHLNDPDEGNYLFRTLLKEYKWLEKKQKEDEKKNVSHAYIASFILPKEKDMDNNLVFWRTYGQEGEGCSLSVNAPLSALREVFYGPNEESVKRTVKELQAVLKLLDPLKIDRPLVQEAVRRILAETVWKSLERIRYLYKSKDYEHEHECRMVILESDIDKDKISFEYQHRNNASLRLRHYCEDESLQIKNLMKSGSKTTLGPCVPYRDNVKKCLEILKKRVEKKVDGFSLEIKTSNILYRKS